VTCQEIHDQITAFVDDRIEEEEYRHKVQQHIKVCSDCRTAYEMELLTKLAVSKHGKPASAPASLRKSIASGVDQLDAERRQQIEKSRPTASANDSWFDRIAVGFLSPAGIGIAVVLVIAGAFGLLYAPAATPTDQVVEQPAVPEPVQWKRPDNPVNFINAASHNYDLIQAGELTVQHQTADPKELEEFFKENGVSYPVLSEIVRAPLAGGVVSNHRVTQEQTEHFAHLVYAKDDMIFYVFEVPVEDLKEGSVVYLTEDMLERLDNGEKFWEQPTPTRTLVMFKQGDIVTVMVANANRPTVEQMVVF
jgi:hypothetical protein